MARGLLAALLLVAGIDFVLSDECVSSEWSHFNGACYYFAPGKTIYLDAKRNCAAMGHNATLVSIHSSAEQEFLNTKYDNVQYWLGLEGASGTWSWIDGTPFDYNNFDTAAVMTRCPMANINPVPLGTWSTVQCIRKNFPYQGTLCKYYLPQDPAVETTTTEPVLPTTTQAPTTTTTEDPCKDVVSAPCADLEYLCEDPKYSNLMADQCPRTCQRCPSDDPPATCSDKESAPCAQLAGTCDLAAFFDVMTSECPKTCGRCPPPCVDRVTAPCSLLTFACANAAYHDLLAEECPRTCGFCLA